MIAGVFVTCALGVVLYRREELSTSSMPQDRSDTEKQLAELRADLARLRHDRSRDTLLALAQAPSAPHEREEPEEPPAEELAKPAPVPSTLAEAVAESADAADQLDNAFAAERPDPSWSSSAGRDINQALSASLPNGSTLVGIECRSSMCRVESRHESLESFQDYVDVSYLSRDRKIWNGAFTSLITSHSQSGVTAVSFVTREGKTMPTIEPSDS